MLAMKREENMGERKRREGQKGMECAGGKGYDTSCLYSLSPRAHIGTHAASGSSPVLLKFLRDNVPSQPASALVPVKERESARERERE